MLDLKEESRELNFAITSRKDEVNKLDEFILSLKNKINSLKDERNELQIKIEKSSLKLSKIKPLYSAIKYSIEKYRDLEIFNDNLQDVLLTQMNEELFSELSPNIILKLHSMDVKTLRKEFNINNKAIDEVLKQYEKKYTTKANLSIYRLMVIALRAELQNVLYNLKYDKLDKAISEIKSITSKYLAIADEGNKQLLGNITKFISEIEYLFINAAKIEYEYYFKKQKEREEQAAIREQMKQESEERKILAQQQKKIEKEEEKYKNEIDSVEQLMNSTIDIDKLCELENKIKELQSKLQKVEEQKEEIINRQNGKAGYVYVISNLGSFGDNVFKIGMTRRLEPMDRIAELSNASVPFSFDVHSFIFSEDAVSLEQKIHQILNERRVNKINLRKEFFSVSINDLEQLVNDIDPAAEFNKTMLAEQYRKSIELQS